MGTHQYEAPVDLPAQELFDYLRDVRHLPEYLPQMTELEPEGGDRVHVAATVDGHQVESEAWLRVDEAAHTLRWGAAGPDDYHGELTVTETQPGSCSVRIELHTERADDAAVQHGLEETVAMLSQSALANADPEKTGQSWH
jgi:uncharacterized membrane protein